MRRRDLIGGSLAALATGRALAGPVPIGGPAGWQGPGGGPSGTAGLGPGAMPGPTLDLSFVNGLAIDSRITYTGSNGTYFNSAGVLTAATTNVARFDFDPVTHLSRGLLIEEARTNIQPSSARVDLFTNSQAVTLTAAVGTAPDGTTNLARIAEAATTDIHFICEFLTVAASTTYTFSVFVSANSTNRYVGLFYDNNGPDGNFAVFDLLAGVVSGAVSAFGVGANGAAMIVPAPGGWRIALSGSIGTSTAARAMVFLTNAATGFLPTYAGNTANNIIAWGAQLEAGAFVSSYIPTTSATPVTRAADVATMAVGAWFNAAAGTLAVEAMQPVAAGKATTLAAFTGASGKTGLTANASNQVAMFDTTGSINASLGAEPVATTFKAGFAFKAGAQAGCLNGGTVITAAAASLTAGATTLSLGYDGTSQQPSGYLRRIRYWPRAMGNSELHVVTT